MSAPTHSDVRFRFEADRSPSSTLLAGFSAFGLAGLTAVDYLVDALDLEETGHAVAEGLPTLTPFEAGRPRHHTRLFSRPDVDVTVLIGELVVPYPAADPLADGVLDWAEDAGVEDVGVLSGVPIAHAPTEHRTYFVATDDYRERHLGGDDPAPMGSGFLDGANAALVRRGMGQPPGVCVYLTPVHQQVPDADAAVRLVETVADVHDLGVDAEPLRQFAAEIQQHYAGLADRLAERERELPEDRMYM